MTQAGLFGAVAARANGGKELPKGQQLKLQGMSRAAAKHEVQLRSAQVHALMLGRKRATVTIEDVRKLFELGGLLRWDLGNAAGSVFSDRKVWERVGYTTAKRAEAHGRLLRVWRLK